MGAIKKPLNPIQETMMHTVGWLEATFTGKCYFLGVDWDTGALTLAGPDAGSFRDQFDNMVKGVYDAKRN